MHPNALEVSRTQNSKHYRNPDGTYSALISCGSIHYQDTPGGAWKDKKQRFIAGAANEWISNESDVSMRTFQVGTGGNRRWWVEFKETLSGKGIRFELQYQPTPVTGTNELRFTDGAQKIWSYFHTRVGGKMLGPSTPTREGPKNYSFRYELLGGADPLVVEADGSIRSGDIFRMARPHLIGADRVNHDASVWSISGDVLSFSYDDTSLPDEAFPYRVDPSTTFNIAAGTDDQYVERSSATYPPSGAVQRFSTSTLCWTDRDLGGSYYVDNSLFRFSTSSLPTGATPYAGIFRAQVVDQTAGDGLSFVMDYYQWNETDTDHTNSPGKSAHAGTALSSISAGTQVDFTLQNLSNISTTTTYFRTGITQRPSDAAPTVGNYISIASFEHTTLTEPQLIIDYALAGYIQVGGDGSGKKKRTQTHTLFSNTVHSGYDIQIAESGDRAQVSNATPSGYGLISRSIDSCYSRTRTQRHFVATNLAGNQTAAALISLTPYTSFAAGTASTTFSVTSGKVFIPEYMYITNRVVTATTIFWGRLELRVDTSATVTASSPLVAAITAPAAAAVVATGQTATMRFFEYIEMPSGASFGLTYITSSGTASRVNFDVALGGFEV